MYQNRGKMQTIDSSDLSKLTTWQLVKLYRMTVVNISRITGDKARELYEQLQQQICKECDRRDAEREAVGLFEPCNW